MRVIYKKTGQTGTIPDDRFDPNLFSRIEEETKPGFASSMFKAVANPASKYVGLLGEAGGQAIRAGADALNPTLRSAKKKGESGEQLTTQERAELDKVAKRSASTMPEKVGNLDFGLKEKDLATQGNIVKSGLKRTVGGMSYAVPGGTGAKGVLKAGAASGALYGASEDDATVESVLGSAAGGAAGAGVLRGAGAVASKTIGKVANKLGQKASSNVLKTSASVVDNAMDQGIDVVALSKKYVPASSTYDDMLGTAADRNKGGIINNLIKQAEEQITKVRRVASTNIKVSGDDIINSLKKERKTIANEIGADSRRKALDKVIKEVEKKYKKGVTVNQALDTLRTANKAFGKAILETEKGAVATSAQKIEANSLRRVLKGMFPEIADALDTQSELLTLRPILSRARASSMAEGMKTGTIDLTRPGTILDPILRNEKVASTLQQLGSKADDTVARATPNLTAGEVTTRAVGAKIGSSMAGQPEQDPGLLGEGVQEQAMGAEGGEFENSPDGQYKTDTATGKSYSMDEQWVFDPELDDWVENPQAGEQDNMPSKQQLKSSYLEYMQAGDTKTANQIKSAYDFLYGDEEGQELSGEQEKALTKLDNAEAIIDNMVKLLEEIGIEDDGLSARASSVLKGVSGRAGYNPKVESFRTLRDGIKVTMARSMGEVGNLTEAEQKAALNMIPDIKMTKAEVRKSTQNTKALLETMRQNILNPGY